MTAIRWILFCLVAFGAGTGVALAVNPPSVGLPPTTASGLAADLDAVQRYAAAGRCDAVRGRIQGAQAKISGLPSDTSAGIVNQLQQGLQDVSRTARANCQDVLSAKAAADEKRRLEQEAAEAAAQATTPTTPVEPTEPTTPDPGADDGGPDPGTGEGEGGGVTTPGGPDTQAPSGGITPDDLEGAQQKLEKELAKERAKWEKRMRKIQDAWGQ